MIIDFHQHYLPSRPQRIDEPRQDWLYHDSRVQGYRDVGALRADMDAAGVDHVVWQGEYFRQQAHCVARNRHVAAVAQREPTRFSAFASVVPHAPDAIATLERAFAEGCVGVGELNPSAQGFSVRDPQVLRCLAFCAEQGVPVVWHVNEPVGPAYPGKTTTALVAFYELAARIPELRLVLAHWGGGLWWYEQIPVVRRVLANVWYDSAAAFFTYPDTAQMARLAAELIPHKVLYGSDYPLRPARQPEGWLQTWTETFAAAAPPALRAGWMGAHAQDVLLRKPVPTREPAPLLRVSLQTPLVLVPEQYPAITPLLQRWGITVDEHTPWWQTIAHALSESGHGPETAALLAQELAFTVPSRTARPDHD